MSAKRRSVHLAWPGALLACALATVSCGDDPEAPFITGGGGNRRDGGNDTDGGLGGSGGGGGGGGVGGTTDDPFEGFTEDKWVEGNPTGLDPEKVYIVHNTGDENVTAEAFILDLAHPGGDAAKDTGRQLVDDGTTFNPGFGDGFATGVWPRSRMRADGALIRRNEGTTLYVVNAEGGDVKIAKCVVGGDDHWLLHPKLGSVIYQCRTPEDETVKIHYQSITAIAEGVDYYREHIYPIPLDYRPLLVGPDGDLLLLKQDECETTECSELHVYHDDELISVPLPREDFLSRLLFFRNTEGGFRLLVHAENFFDVPPLPAVIPEPPERLPPIFFPPVAMQLWEITYEGEMTKIHDFDSPGEIANNCKAEPDEVIYPEHPEWLGYMDYTGEPEERSNTCKCALAWDGSLVCAGFRSAYFMNFDGTTGLLWQVEGDPSGTERIGWIEALVTGT